MLKQHLQIYREFYELWINRAELKRYGKEEVIGKKLYYYRRQIEMEYPNNKPRYPNPAVLPYEFYVIEYPISYRHDRFLRQPLIRFQRFCVYVIVVVYLTVNALYNHNYQDKTRQEYSYNLQKSRKFFRRNHTPQLEVFTIEKPIEIVFRLIGKAFKIRRQVRGII